MRLPLFTAIAVDHPALVLAVLPLVVPLLEGKTKATGLRPVVESLLEVISRVVESAEYRVIGGKFRASTRLRERVAGAEFAGGRFRDI